MRFWLWYHTFALAEWLALHGWRRANGARWPLPLARLAYRLSNRLWRDEWSPDW